MEGSIKIPLAEGINSSGFTLAAHPRRPTLYVTGESNNLYICNLLHFVCNQRESKWK